MILGLPWGTDLEGRAMQRGIVKGRRRRKGASPSLSDGSKSQSTDEGEGTVRSED
jgi:hypothetical protein